MKQLLRACLEFNHAGQFTSEMEVSPDPQNADGYFVPNPERSSPVTSTLLGRMSDHPCSFEVFSAAPDVGESKECVRKLLNLHHILEGKEPNAPLPRQWIISSGLPKSAFGELGARRAKGWPEGVYRLARAFDTFFIVASELPEDRSTLLLRLMGRGRTLRRAVEDLKKLSEDDFERCTALPILVRFRIEAAAEPVSTVDEEFLMNTQEVMDMFEQRAEQRGEQRGLVRQRKMVLRQLRRKFGDLPEAILARVDAADADTLDRFADKLLFAASPQEVVADEP